MEALFLFGLGCVYGLWIAWYCRTPAFGAGEKPMVSLRPGLVVHDYNDGTSIVFDRRGRLISFTPAFTERENVLRAIGDKCM